MPKAKPLRKPSQRTTAQRGNKATQRSKSAGSQARQKGKPAQDVRPFPCPQKPYPLSSYVAPSWDDPSSQLVGAHTLSSMNDDSAVPPITKKGRKTGTDKLFPHFPERICFELGCSVMAPHAHNPDDIDYHDLPSAEEYRKRYEALEVQRVRATIRPSQRFRTVADRHHQTLKEFSKIFKPMPFSRPILPPIPTSSVHSFGGVSGDLGRALPRIPRRVQKPRRSPHIQPPKTRLPNTSTLSRTVKSNEAEESDEEPFRRQRRPKGSSAPSLQEPEGVSSGWVANLELGATFRRVMEEVVDGAVQGVRTLTI